METLKDIFTNLVVFVDGCDDCPMVFAFPMLRLFVFERTTLTSGRTFQIADDEKPCRRRIAIGEDRKNPQRVGLRIRKTLGRRVKDFPPIRIQKAYMQLFFHSTILPRSTINISSATAISSLGVVIDLAIAATFSAGRIMINFLIATPSADLLTLARLIDPSGSPLTVFHVRGALSVSTLSRCSAVAKTASAKSGPLLISCHIVLVFHCHSLAPERLSGAAECELGGVHGTSINLLIISAMTCAHCGTHALPMPWRAHLRHRATSLAAPLTEGQSADLVATLGSSHSN